MPTVRRLALTASILIANFVHPALASPSQDAQNPPTTTTTTTTTTTATTTAPCPAPDELRARHLYGLWRAEFSPAAPHATLLLERHPELAESVRGVLQRDGQRAWLAGDVDNGDFTLEESQDGRTISATWLGEVSPEGCGREITGTWTQAQPTLTRRFVLRKVAD